jgi:hypothetical protein
MGTSYAEWGVSEKLIEDWLQPETMDVSPELSIIALGADALRLERMNVPRWRTYYPDGSFTHRGMNSTFWSDFLQNDSHSIHCEIEITRIDTEHTDYVRVFGINRRTSTAIEYRALRVHVSAGPTSTPSILAKSGLIDWASTNFQWHPMIRVIAKTDAKHLGFNDIDPFQAWTADRKLKFGSAVSTASLLAINLRRIIDQEESTSLRSYYVSFSSSGNGGIIPFTSLPWYKYSQKDRQLSRDGLHQLQELVRAGGGSILNAEELKPMKQSTVHIFGTLPINGPNFIPGTNRLRRDERVFVSDGSLLPIGPGVNPQGVIMTTVDVMLRASK